MVGGKYGKVKGFDFYIQDGDRLKPFQRRKLVSESEVYICEIMDKLNPMGKSFEQIMNGPEFLDPDYHDLELMEYWNEIYNKYGFLINDFKSKWEREFIGNQMEFGDVKDESKPSEPLKIEWLEKRKRKKKYSELMG